MEVMSGDNGSYKTCKAPVKSSLPTNQSASFLQAGSGYSTCHQSSALKALKRKLLHPTALFTRSLHGSLKAPDYLAKPLVSPLTPVPQPVHTA